MVALFNDHVHLESRFTRSTSSPIRAIHRSTSSLFSRVSFSCFSSARFSCSPNATISSCACSTIRLLPLSSSSRSRTFLSSSAFCRLSCAVCVVDVRVCACCVLSADVSSSTCVCKAVRAFCVVARSVRRLASRSFEGCCWSVVLDAALLVRVGIASASERALLEPSGCGDDDGGTVADGLLLISRAAVRSASLVSAAEDG